MSATVEPWLTRQYPQAVSATPEERRSATVEAYGASRSRSPRRGVPCQQEAVSEEASQQEAVSEELNREIAKRQALHRRRGVGLPEEAECNEEHYNEEHCIDNEEHFIDNDEQASEAPNSSRAIDDQAHFHHCSFRHCSILVYPNFRYEF